MKRANNPIEKARLLGRLSNELESDAGRLVHAVMLLPAKRPKCPFNDWGRKVIKNDDFKTMKSVCGKVPGPRSVGWEYDNKAPVSCPRCLNWLKKHNHKVSK